jgi:hypothetical protein
MAIAKSLGDASTYPYLKCIIGKSGQVGERAVVHQFYLSDVDDPDLYAAESLHNWETSEPGQWVMSNSVQVPIWNRMLDHTTYGYTYQIYAWLTPKDLTWFLLKWGK